MGSFSKHHACTLILVSTYGCPRSCSKGTALLQFSRCPASLFLILFPPLAFLLLGPFLPLRLHGLLLRLPLRAEIAQASAAPSCSSIPSPGAGGGGLPASSVSCHPKLLTPKVLAQRSLLGPSASLAAASLGAHPSTQRLDFSRLNLSLPLLRSSSVGTQQHCFPLLSGWTPWN